MSRLTNLTACLAQTVENYLKLSNTNDVLREYLEDTFKVNETRPLGECLMLKVFNRGEINKILRRKRRSASSNEWEAILYMIRTFAESLDIEVKFYVDDLRNKPEVFNPVKAKRSKAAEVCLEKTKLCFLKGEFYMLWNVREDTRPAAAAIPASVAVPPAPPPLLTTSAPVEMQRKVAQYNLPSLARTSDYDSDFMSVDEDSMDTITTEEGFPEDLIPPSQPSYLKLNTEDQQLDEWLKDIEDRNTEDMYPVENESQEVTVASNQQQSQRGMLIDDKYGLSMPMNDRSFAEALLAEEKVLPFEADEEGPLLGKDDPFLSSSAIRGSANHSLNLMLNYL